MSGARKTPKHGTRSAPTRRSIPGALTDRECRAAVCPEGKTEVMLHDGASLYLRVRPSGRKTWVYLYGSRPRVRLVHLVPFPDTTLAAARLWAAKQRDMVRTNSADPVQQHRTARATVELARTQTLESMMETVWEDMQQRGQPSWTNTKSVFQHTPAWARRMQPTHVTHDHAEAILREIRTATDGTKVAKAYQAALSAGYTRAITARAGMNPKRLNPALAAYGVRENPFKGHDIGIPGGVSNSFLTREEAQGFIARLLLEPASDERDLLLMVLYMGGQRCVQLAAATITVEQATQAPCLLLLDAKQKGGEPRPHVLPVVGPALELLAARGMLAEGDAIFGVDYKGAYGLAKRAGDLCYRVVKRWARELARKGKTVKRFSKKALRSTASTGMAELGIGEKMVDLLLSHGQKSIDWKHYNRWEYIPQKREALAQWHRWLAEPAPKPKLAADAGKVVPLRRAA
jgi:Arm DNA-binding domain